jgi:hypothetical protein
MKLSAYRVFALPFFIAAVFVYIHVTYLAAEPAGCASTVELFNVFNLDCLMSSSTWAVVCACAIPGVLLWAIAR